MTDSPNLKGLIERLTTAQVQTLREMESYDPYYSWRPKSAQALVDLGLAEAVPVRLRHREVGRRITQMGREVLATLRASHGISS
jgi:hypothetical protein